MASILTSNSWRCPNCGLPLFKLNSQWRCDNNHCFDISKEGHVNLLLSNEKRSKEPGDNKEMMNARRAFLEAGHYNPLIKKLGEFIALKLQSTSTAAKQHVLDVGCGEGFYLQQLIALLGTEAFSYQGIDISKIAIQKAAKRKVEAEFAVASSYKLPALDAALDVILQIFAPSNEDEIGRILKPDGIWLLVQPGPEHLFELKQQIYDSPEKHEEKAFSSEQFQVISQDLLQYKFELTDKSERMALLKMTPYYWSITEEKKQNVVEELSSLTADFMITALKKKGL